MSTSPPPGITAEDLEPSRRAFGESWTLPAPVYVSSDVLAWERRHFFDEGWVCAGRAADVAEPGSRRAVTVGEASVLVVRGVDRALTALANVCRHRGHELLACGAHGEGPVVTCPYHGWVYGLDGSLRGAAGLGRPLDTLAGELDLVMVQHAEWGGFVFVNVSGDAPPLTEAR